MSQLKGGTPECSFTPGPWRYSEVLGGCWVYAPEGFQILAYTHSPEPVNKANARLVAAAPELLDALERIVQLNERLPEDHPSRLSHGEQEQAIAAIKKARGQ